MPTPDQKAHRITKLLIEEEVPMFGVPEASFAVGPRHKSAFSHYGGLL